MGFIFGSVGHVNDLWFLDNNEYIYSRKMHVYLIATPSVSYQKRSLCLCGVRDPITGHLVVL